MLAPAFFLLIALLCPTPVATIDATIRPPLEPADRNHRHHDLTDMPTRAALSAPPRIAHPLATQISTTDVLVNDRTHDPACPSCGGKPFTQAEVSVAANGPNVLVCWNDKRSSCLHVGSQGLGYSADFGVSYTDASPVAGPPGFNYGGDGTVAANAKTGDFYFLALISGTGFGFNVGAIKGHFAGGSFVIDVNKQVGFNGNAGNSLDKTWVAVDSTSGNVYAVWSNYIADGSEHIELQRLDASLNALGPVQVINAEPANVADMSMSVVATGPNGLVYVSWLEIGSLPDHRSRIRIRRSDDCGATFGPPATVAEIMENVYSGAPGCARGACDAAPSLAIDASRGPHRGRAYVSWDETVNFYTAPFAVSTAAVEIENDNFFSRATSFVPGGKIRGIQAAGSDRDFFKFTALRGQTFVARTDTSGGFYFRIIAPADTSSSGNYKTLANAIGPGAGVVCTLPSDGTYYLLLDPDGTAPSSTPYAISTAFVSPGVGDRARDQRDQFLAYSDDGAAWSAPVRVNDSDAWFDGIFPWAAVDSLGRVFCFWHDARVDAVTGCASDEYMTASGDGGVTWSANRRLTDVSSYFSYFNVCGPNNQGDYQQAACSGARVYCGFPDSRFGNPDVFVNANTFLSSGLCPAPIIADGGVDVPINFQLRNDGNSDTPLSWQAEDSQGWLTGAVPALSGTQTVTANGGVFGVQATVHVPNGCSGDSTTVRFITYDPFIPGYYDTCSTIVHCSATTGVPLTQHQRTRLAPPLPNPARGTAALRYALERPGAADLAIFSVTGSRVRLLRHGFDSEGNHEAWWDGRDDQGHLAPGGMYFIRLDAIGRTFNQRLMLLR